MSQIDPLQLSQMILESLDGTISPSDFERLDQLIQNEPDVAQLYVKLMNSHIIFSQQGLASRIYSTDEQIDTDNETEDLLRDMIEKEEYLVGIKEDEMSARHKELVKSKAQKQLAEFLSHQSSHEVRSSEPAKIQREKTSQSKKILWAMAACLLMSVFIWLFYPSRDAKSVSKLINTFNTQWPYQASIFKIHEIYNLPKGLAEIEFDSGAKIILEGPAEIKMNSANGAYLNLGKLVAHVPPRAQGFTIKTPNAKFVDLGTEFGVSVEGRSSTLSVFKGQVAVVMPDSGFQDKHVIQSGQHVIAKNNEVVISDKPQSIQFVRAIPTANDSADQKIKSSRSECVTPALYINHDILKENKYSQINWRGPKHLDEQTIRFDGKYNQLLLRNIKVNESETKFWRDGYSWSFWFKPDLIKELCLFKVITREHSDLESNKDYHHDDDQLHWLSIKLNKSNQPVISYIFNSHVEYDSAKNREHEIVTPALSSHQEWIHVAASYYLDRVRLYMNGQLVKDYQIPDGHDIFGDDTDSFIFGRTLNSKLGKLKGKKFMRFKGSMDDMLFYECDLTSQDIFDIYTKQKRYKK